MGARELHVIENKGLVTLLDTKHFIYECGYWPVLESDAVRLIGGMLYCTKLKRNFQSLVASCSHRREEEIEQYRGRIARPYFLRNAPGSRAPVAPLTEKRSYAFVPS
jgi:hypothetical protein